MKKNPPRPKPLPETEFTGEVQEFSVVALAPDDPSLEVRERRGRPNDTHRRPDIGPTEKHSAE
jgi:hypothetical protein